MVFLIQRNLNMDIDETCLSRELPVIPCSSDQLLSSSIVGETCEDSSREGSGSKCDTLKDCTNNTEENSKRFIKESKIHLLSDSEDSFEVFLPKKCSNVIKPVINAKPLPIGKQKTKKSKTRSCPYFSTKSVKSYFKPPSKTQEEKDLEIALARSLLDISGGEYPVITSNKNLRVEKKPSPKGSPLKLKNWTGKESKKSKTTLQRRTKEDRDRIITQKVAIVLLEKKETSDDCFLKRDIELTSSILEGYFDKDSKLWELSKLSKDSFLTDFYVDSLKHFIEQPSPAFCAKEQNSIPEGLPLVVEVAADMNVIQEDISKMYSSESGTTLGISATVDNLPDESQHPTLPKEEPASSFKNEPPNTTEYNKSLQPSYSFNDESSCFPNSEPLENNGYTSFPHSTSLKEELPTSSKCEPPETPDYEYSQHPSSHKEFASSSKSEHPETTDYESSQKSNYFLTNFESLKLLSDNWFSLYNRKEYSDIEILLAEGFIPGHALVLHVRCPLLLNDMSPVLNHNVIDLSQFSQRASVVFLKYIYCGKTDAISNLTIDEKRDVTILSKKYDLSSLHSLLITETNLIDLYNQSTCEPSSQGSSHCSNNSPDKSCKLKEKAKTDSVNEVKLDDKQGIQPSSDSFPTARTPEKESLDLTRPFSLFSKTVSDIFEESYHSSSPVTKAPLSDNKHELSSDVINLVESNSSNSASPKRTIDSSKNIHFEFNGRYELINLVQSPEPPAKKVHLLESEVITLDSDSGDAPPKSPFKSEYPKESNNIPDDYDINHYSLTNFELNDLNSSFNQFKENESEDQIKQNNTQERLVEDSSLHKCLQSSFPNISQVDEIELQARHKHFPSHLSSTPLSSPVVTSSLKNRLSTPKQDSSIIIKDATPRANYSKMALPELQKELRKYGLKPNLDRKKAITLLNYIYDQIHLAIEPPELFKSSIASTSQENPSNVQSSSLPATTISLSDKSLDVRPIHPESEHFIPSIPSTSRENPSILFNSLPSTSCSYDKESSEDSCEEEQSNEFALEEMIFNESKREESPSEAEPSSLKQIIANFLKSDADLFTSIVTFEPLLLNSFHKTLKDHGVRCSMSDLMDTLDELCVNYRIEKHQKTGAKSRKRKRGAKKL